jgi:hypothetical protein
MCIDSIQEWNLIEGELTRLHYYPYMTQFEATDPAGFITLFWSVGNPDIKVVTHNHDVQSLIDNFSSAVLCPPPARFTSPPQTTGSGNRCM